MLFSNIVSSHFADAHCNLYIIFVSPFTYFSIHCKLHAQASSHLEILSSCQTRPQEDKHVQNRQLKIYHFYACSLLIFLTISIFLHAPRSNHWWHYQNYSQTSYWSSLSLSKLPSNQRMARSWEFVIQKCLSYLWNDWLRCQAVSYHRWSGALHSGFATWGHLLIF